MIIWIGGLMTTHWFRWQRTSRTWLLLGFLVLSGGLGSVKRLEAAPTVESIRWSAWDRCLDSAQAQPAGRYAFYLYRTLAVPHPEIYLDADHLFSDVIRDLPGAGMAYSSKGTRDIRLYKTLAHRMQLGRGFGWGDWRIQPDSIYDSDKDRKTAWFDRRLPSVGVLLKTASPRLSTAETAVMRYAQLRSGLGDSTHLYVIIDAKGAGYLASDTALWLAGLPDRAVRDWASVKPALVFNETSVYYPLFARDDRETDSTLRALVARLGASTSPALSKEEQARLERLRTALALPDSTSHRLAVLLAAGLTDVKQPRVDAAWQEYLGSSPEEDAPCGTVLVREALLRANALSPFTASQALSLLSLPFDSAICATEFAYQTRMGNTAWTKFTSADSSELWGILWSFDLFEMVVDDNIRTRAGSAFAQGSPMAAALDLAGIKLFQASLRSSKSVAPSNDWVVTSDGRYRYNLGHWTRLPQYPRAKLTLLLNGFVSNGRAVVIDSAAYCSGLPDLEVAQELTEIESKLADKANLFVIPPHGAMMLLGRFAADLAANLHRSISPAWPPPGSR
jgi:hypothetical protein